MQAAASTLQKEWANLQSSTGNTEVQLRGDVGRLQGQLESALDDCKHTRQQCKEACQVQLAAQVLASHLIHGVLMFWFDSWSVSYWGGGSAVRHNML